MLTPGIPAGSAGFLLLIWLPVSVDPDHLAGIKENRFNQPLNPAVVTHHADIVFRSDNFYLSPS